ncbi:MAG TPA: hypothetical protein VF296_06535, partial [Gallionella sp.]
MACKPATCQRQTTAPFLAAIATRYKNDAVVLRGLQALARIYQDKTNQPMQAIATYRKLDDTFRGHDGMDALSKAEKLAFYTLKDWNLS